MPFVRIKGAANNFGKPINWDENRDGPCGDLWVRVDMYQHYRQHNFAWRPSPHELTLLMAGGAIEVSLVSDFMPPVGVSVVQKTDDDAAR